MSLFERLVRYFCTAGVAAVVDVGGFVLLSAFGAAIAPAAVLSFVAAAVVNYLLTSRLVFGHAAAVRGFALFLGAALIGLAVNVTTTVLAAEELGLPGWSAKILGVGVAFFVNFGLNAGIVFRGRATRQRHS